MKRRSSQELRDPKSAPERDPTLSLHSNVDAGGIRERCASLHSDVDPQFVWKVIETTWWNKRKEVEDNLVATSANRQSALAVAAALGYKACFRYLVKMCGKDYAVSEIPPLPALSLCFCSIGELEGLLGGIAEAMESEHEGTTYSVEKEPLNEKRITVERLVKEVLDTEALRAEMLSGDH